MDIYDIIKSGNLEGVIQWHNDGKEITYEAMDEAAENGHLNIVKWLHENRTEGCSTKAIDDAAGNGFLDVVKWLHENRTEGCTTSAIDLAAISGHFDIVKFLHENRTEGCTNKAFDGIFNPSFYLDFSTYYKQKEKIDSNNKTILKFLYNNYKHLVTKVNDNTYEKLLPLIQEDFRKKFEKIEKENIVREFLSKKLVYHPSSCYMKRIVDNF